MLSAPLRCFPLLHENFAMLLQGLCNESPLADVHILTSMLCQCPLLPSTRVQAMSAGRMPAGAPILRSLAIEALHCTGPCMDHAEGSLSHTAPFIGVQPSCSQAVHPLVPDVAALVTIISTALRSNQVLTFVLCLSMGHHLPELSEVASALLHL